MFSYGFIYIDTPVLANQQISALDTAYSLVDLSGVMDNRDRWWEREIRDTVLLAWLDDEDDYFNHFYYFINDVWYDQCF